VNVRTRIKVCGLTSAADAAEAVRAGADAVGVILSESPRQVTLEQAETIFRSLPPYIGKVGVFVDAPLDLVERVVEVAGLTTVQYHGSETPEDCAAAPVQVVKSFKVGTEFDSRVMEPFRGTVAAVLLDTYHPQLDGGTGTAFDWQSITGLPEWAPFVLAGGLNPANVGEGIRELRPYAVDVSSGVEERPGAKDRQRLHAFVASVRMADQELS
jgi:phosphoribosylanthranilate isomerase